MWTNSTRVESVWHFLPVVEQTLVQLAGFQVFTKLDANSGFWQIPISADSLLLTSFLTPLPMKNGCPTQWDRRIEWRVWWSVFWYNYGKDHLLKVPQHLEAAGPHSTKRSVNSLRNRSNFLVRWWTSWESARNQPKSRRSKRCQYPKMLARSSQHGELLFI